MFIAIPLLTILTIGVLGLTFMMIAYLGWAAFWLCLLVICYSLLYNLLN